jgi:hypothetical protein
MDWLVERHARRDRTRKTFGETARALLQWRVTAGGGR